MDLGIDIGGSGIKGAPVDLEKGAFAQERLRIDTPKKSTPDAVLDIVGQIVEHFGADGPIGITIPGIVRGGVVRSAANIDKAWIGFDLAAAARERFGRSCAVLNDADAAGVAEMHYGAGKDMDGVILMLTLGTGIGSALLVGDVLVPNTELGHLELWGVDAETKAAASAREREDLSFKKWGGRLDEYLHHVEMLFSPDLIVIGGGDAKRFDKFEEYLTVETPVRPSVLKNDAGIIGAAWMAARGQGPGRTGQGQAAPSR